MSLCYCGSSKEFEKCCSPYISGAENAPTAEATMRARYSAFASGSIDFVEKTHHPKSDDEFDREETESWAKNSDWQGLKIIEVNQGSATDTKGTVEFVASYSNSGAALDHHELATFEKIDGMWFFEDGKVFHSPLKRSAPKLGRNDPCSCGSGKKFKRCCG
ncbi:MAG: YchJ family protein [Bacteriovoracaceae bacterium]|jgi:SEC-C motif domain protein|nr:YchJ family protein [Bacteriovoracaceae bacterium]